MFKPISIIINDELNILKRRHFNDFEFFFDVILSNSLGNCLQYETVFNCVTYEFI